MIQFVRTLSSVVHVKSIKNDIPTCLTYFSLYMKKGCRIVVGPKTNHAGCIVSIFVNCLVLAINLSWPTHVTKSHTYAT